MCRHLQAKLMAMVVGLATSLTFVGMARASLVAVDDFESYADNTTIINGTGGSGWSQPWIGNTTTGAPTANAASGKIAGHGQSLELGATADNRGIAVRQFPSQSGEVYIGMTLQTTNDWDGDFWQIYVNDTYATADSTTPAFSAGLLNDSPLNRYFVRKGPATAAGSTNSSALQHTSASSNIHTLVMKLSKSTGMAADLYDEVTLWVDQLTEGSPTAVLGAADLGTTSLNSASLSTLHFRVSSLEATDRVYLDNLRVATTFAAAVGIPEPASAALLALGSMMAMFGRGLRNRYPCIRSSERVCECSSESQ